MKSLQYAINQTLRHLPLRATAWVPWAALLLWGCSSIQIRPLTGGSADTGAPLTQHHGSNGVVFRFFDEDYVAGGYAYWYPERANVFIPEESGKHGEVALQFDLVADDFSGGSVCLHNLLYDMRPYLNTGALQFWVKGAQGGEIAWVALVDEELTDGKKTVVRLPLNQYGGISNEWTHVSVPLRDFGRRGVYWDEKKRVEVPEPFDWQRVAEFRIEIKKGENKRFRVWVDDIFVVRDVYEPVADSLLFRKEWDERDEQVSPPPLAQTPDVDIRHTFFDADLARGGFTYVYGGRTAAVQVTSDDAHPASSVLGLYLDNTDYSGVTIALEQGRVFDLSQMRESAAGIAFWARGGPNATKAYLGLLDDESNGFKTQTKLSLADFGRLDTTWKWFMVPLKRFLPQGLYWDDARQAEINAPVDWKRISEVRFSTNRYENRVGDDDPVELFIDRVVIIDSIPGYVDRDRYWDEFSSDKPDVVLHDFEDGIDDWETSHGPKSEITIRAARPDNPQRYGRQSLEIEYRLGDYCDALCNYAAHGYPAQMRDWSGHWGLRFSLYTENAYQGVTVQIGDSGNELWVANTGGKRGWNEILVPFRLFHKFPYYQPPDAVENGVFNLENVTSIDFKPAGEGTRGVFLVDNVLLTNAREIEQPPVPEQVNVTISGSPATVLTPAINEGIFGINVALWDADLLLPETIEYVKNVNHGVLRYPGGLRADDDHWYEVLAAQDWMVDTDEYLWFLEQTGTTGMITVNFGRGTPQEAADWVRHVNITREAGIRYWEVGNELYGDWHTHHCTAEEYGERAAEFIRKMKEVDPSILVGVVWVIEGEWNRTVFEYTRDLADAVIVHHYPQHAGQENDFALLASPQSLDHIIGGVRRQVEAYGTPGRNYEIWLTEWNSVDFNPGPQTLSLVNGLFVADYLGMLARHNIEQASYWDVHNSITPEGGDYGYLSRTGAPDGDNVPRPSYFAFLMASHALQGALLETSVDHDDVTAYLARHENGTRALMLINKMPQTRADARIAIPEFNGTARVVELWGENERTGPLERSAQIETGTIVELRPHSITVLYLD